LLERAAAEGKDPAALALEPLEGMLASDNGLSAAASGDARVAAWRRFVAALRERTRSLPSMHRVDDSREAIYEDRGE